MFIYTSAEIKEADSKAERMGMSLFALMENAGNGLFRKTLPLFKKTDNILIVAGRGNNGGDGVVLARYLKNHGYQADLVFPLGEPKTETAAEHYAYFRACGYEAAPFSEEKNYDWIIDGLLGVGSRLPLRGDLARITDWINRQQARVIAIDVPTGVPSDTGTADEHAVRADYTFSLHGFKPSAFLFPSSDYYGKIAAIDIGIPQEGRFRIWTEEDVRRTFPKATGNTHKGSFGTGLLIAGSDEMPGSAALAAIGVMRFGAGKLTIATSRHASTIIGPLVPEATFTFNLENTDLGQFSAIAVGPGLPPDGELEALIQKILGLPVPVILDAGALSKRNYMRREKPVIITPHPGEFSRLTGKTVREIQANRLELASQYAAENNLIVVLKGKYTVIAFPDGTGFVNMTGNRALSKGGTGDTLTGMLLAAAGTHRRIEDAVANAVYLHGECADEWIIRNGEGTMVAHDFAGLLPEVCRRYETGMV